jgi:hypothetical protein
VFCVNRADRFNIVRPNYWRLACAIRYQHKDAPAVKRGYVRHSASGPTSKNRRTKLVGASALGISERVFLLRVLHYEQFVLSARRSKSMARWPWALLMLTCRIAA